MAPPTLTESLPTAPHQLSHPNSSPSPSSPAKTATTSPANASFPDGLKTSGQHNPIYSLLKPYSSFPTHITGPTVWKSDDYHSSPEKWTHRLTSSELSELSCAADAFINSGTPLTGISRSNFPLPSLSKFLAGVRDDLLNGKGFILLKGFPVAEWGLHKSAVAYMGLGTYLGYFTSQNSRGHVLGHVKDLGEDASRTDRVRIYRTNARQFFHVDGADLVGLLCIAKSLLGGESDIVSTHHVINTLQQTHPEVIKLMTEPVWYFDRKGEVSKWQEQWIRSSILYMETEDKESGREPRVYAKFDPMNLTSLSRFNSGPDAKIPPLSDAQKHALKVWEDTCAELSLHMILEPGDVQLLSNSHVFHARTAYTDYPPGSVDEEGCERKRRHLMRLWLAVPEGEGGWRLPFHDARVKKRGGVQVDDTPPVCPLDAE